MHYSPLKARDATKYPALFQNYWGSFTIKKNDTITPEIIENRNRFVEEFGISKQVNYQALWPFTSNSNFDHQEKYKTRNGKIILICSNYFGDYPATHWLKMKIYNKLYSTEATTFIRILNNVSDMRNIMKKARRNEVAL